MIADQSSYPRFWVNYPPKEPRAVSVPGALLVRGMTSSQRPASGWETNGVTALPPPVQGWIPLAGSMGKPCLSDAKHYSYN